MKNFLLKILTFSTYLGVGILAILVSADLLISNNENFKLEKGIEHILIGQSQPECAFNDALISNFKNLAQSGETYFYSFLKVRQILKDNPQIQTVFIEFTNNNFTPMMDEQIWNDKYTSFRYPRYSAFMPIGDKALLFRKNPNAVIKAFPITLKDQIARIRNNNFNIVSITGGYFYVKKNMIDSTLKNQLNNDTFDLAKNNKKSVYNIKYLKKIVTLCKQKNINIYFVRSPIYNNSANIINEELFNEIKTTLFPKIVLLDFINFPLEKEDFADNYHLNFKGASKFSKSFNNALQNDFGR